MEDNKKFLIVGLGNIGNEYTGTRHNIGFEVVHTIAEQLSAPFQLDRYAYIARAKFKGRMLLFILPTTYMNLSGKAVKYWLDHEKIKASNSLIISDDIDLNPGQLRVKAQGGGGSHNGLNHIIETLGHQNFPRLRFGIGKNYAQGYQIEYVLGRFESEEMNQKIQPAIEIATEIIKSFAIQGIQKTMECYNQKAKQPKE